MRAWCRPRNCSWQWRLKSNAPEKMWTAIVQKWANTNLKRSARFGEWYHIFQWLVSRVPSGGQTNQEEKLKLLGGIEPRKDLIRFAYLVTSCSLDTRSQPGQCMLCLESVCSNSFKCFAWPTKAWFVKTLLKPKGNKTCDLWQSEWTNIHSIRTVSQLVFSVFIFCGAVNICEENWTAHAIGLSYNYTTTAKPGVKLA